MNYAQGELHHEEEILVNNFFNLLENNYIVHCQMENVKFDEHNRPYEQTPNGKIYLSKRAYNYSVKN